MKHAPVISMGIIALILAIVVSLLSNFLREKESNEILIHNAQQITEAKYTSENLAKLGEKYREYAESMTEQLYRTVFDLDNLHSSPAIPNFTGVTSIHYNHIDTLQKKTNSGRQLFVIATANLEIDVEHTTITLKIMERYTIDKGKIVDYAVIF